MSPNKKRWARRLGLLALVPVLICSAWFASLSPAGHVDFFLHRSRYEAIMQAMKARPPRGAQQTDTTTIAEKSVSAQRDEAGQYTISLTTFDGGHYGRSGYLFSDTSPIPTVGDPYSDVRTPEGLWMLGKQVAPRWWVITSHLD
jgi:hypothetical protein